MEGVEEVIRRYQVMRETEGQQKVVTGAGLGRTCWKENTRLSY